jgi:hypothetical protein
LLVQSLLSNQALQNKFLTTLSNPEKILECQPTPLNLQESDLAPEEDYSVPLLLNLSNKLACPITLEPSPPLLKNL